MAKELLKLRMKHGLSLNDVADICGIDVGYVARMELGVPVKLYYARRLRRPSSAPGCAADRGGVADCAHRG